MATNVVKKVLTCYEKDEIIIAQAIAKMAKEENSNIAATARDFGISDHKLRSRFAGRQSRIDRRSLNRKLNIEQEQAL
ncbi:MAG: hypothetical protein M1829_004610 [Trizodia sp. TS-e1964]|nr:MAG: hypothetical protein M1829_004610 [Trizodia sp. TS-e1964]